MDSIGNQIRDSDFVIVGLVLYSKGLGTSSKKNGKKSDI